jgi:hypothetical protein
MVWLSVTVMVTGWAARWSPWPSGYTAALRKSCCTAEMRLMKEQVVALLYAGGLDDLLAV